MQAITLLPLPRLELLPPHLLQLALLLELLSFLPLLLLVPYIWIMNTDVVCTVWGNRARGGPYFAVSILDHEAFHLTFPYFSAILLRFLVLAHLPWWHMS